MSAAPPHDDADDDEDVAGHAADLDALRLLSAVSELLSRRDQEQAVSELARLVVPALADWCTVTVGTRERRTLGGPTTTRSSSRSSRRTPPCRPSR